jgi:hypothetical protein
MRVQKFPQNVACRVNALVGFSCQEYRECLNADASSLPSGEKAAEVTTREWPSSLARAAPAAGSQSLTVLS